MEQEVGEKIILVTCFALMGVSLSKLKEQWPQFMTRPCALNCVVVNCNAKLNGLQSQAHG